MRLINFDYELGKVHMDEHIANQDAEIGQLVRLVNKAETRIDELVMDKQVLYSKRDALHAELARVRENTVPKEAFDTEIKVRMDAQREANTLRAELEQAKGKELEGK